MKSARDFSIRLDHLVVCASGLSDGVTWFQELSGVQMPFGGKHPLMGTHNHLSALSEDSFIEIIAIDPEAGKTALPERGQRWYTMDDASHQQRVAVAPRLTTWVLATDNLDAALAKAREAGIDPGEPLDVTRGDLSWRLSVRSDGSLACGGVFPSLIEWTDHVNPVVRMQDQGIRLNQLNLQHTSPQLLKKALQAIGAAELVSVSEGEPALVADLRAGEHNFTLYS